MQISKRNKINECTAFTEISESGLQMPALWLLCYHLTITETVFKKPPREYCTLQFFPVILNQLRKLVNCFSSVQFSSVSQACLTLCGPMNHSMPGLPVHHKLPESTQTHAHQVGDAIQPSHPLSCPSPAPNPCQHQGLFQRVNSLHEVSKILEFQLQHQSFQWTPRTDIF